MKKDKPVKRTKSNYPAIGYVGNDRLSGLYGVSGGIIDMKGTGLLHLFHDRYEYDLIHSGCTMVQTDDHIYYGNKHERRLGHQVHMMPTVSKTINGHILYDAFDIEEGKLFKEDYVTGYGEHRIAFRTDLTNNNSDEMTVTFHAYVTVNPFVGQRAEANNHTSRSHVGDKILVIGDGEDSEGHVVMDAPTGFLYRTTQNLFYQEPLKQVVQSDINTVSLLRSRKVILQPGETYTYTWVLDVYDAGDTALGGDGLQTNLNNVLEDSRVYWDKWFESGDYQLLMDNLADNQQSMADSREHIDRVKTCLAAMKSSQLNGFVPADLTGHYFANGMPCYYARDAMMTARSFMMAGYYEDFEAVMTYLIHRRRKSNGEFFQRYNGLGEPDEGANNNVFHQLDSIGFFMYNIWKYHSLTGKMLVPFDYLLPLFELLEKNERKFGLIGIEGGVNEGVYGGAYITSSNAFICGGLYAFDKMCRSAGEDKIGERCRQLIAIIEEGIKTTYIPSESRYAYGYVDYSDTLVKKFDTPLYFATLFGWDGGEAMKSTHDYYKLWASYYGEGIGYSEQEYHHGPWIFNTSAAAQYSYLIGDYDTYDKTIAWLDRHSNGYGLMPEAIDGEDEDQCFINPLTWATSEYVAAAFMNVNDRERINDGKVIL